MVLVIAAFKPSLLRTYPSCDEGVHTYLTSVQQQVATNTPFNFHIDRSLPEAERERRVAPEYVPPPCASTVRTRDDVLPPSAS